MVSLWLVIPIAAISLNSISPVVITSFFTRLLLSIFISFKNGSAESIIPKGKLFCENRKEPGERGKYEGEIVHLTGGNTVANESIKQMKKDGIKLFARLDHDDAWNKDHLKNISICLQELGN